MKTSVWNEGLRAFPLLFAAAGALLAAPVSAQIAKHQVEAGLRLSYADLSSYDLKDAAGYGARVGVQLSKAWGIQLDFERVSTKVDVPDGADARVNISSLAGLWNFQKKEGKKHYAFLSMGAGLMNGLEASDRDSADFITVGGGIRWFHRRHFLSRFDIRLLSSGNDGSLLDAFSANHVNFEAAAGVSWLFGGGKSAPKSPETKKAETKPAPEEKKEPPK